MLKQIMKNDNIEIELRDRRSMICDDDSDVEIGEVDLDNDDNVTKNEKPMILSETMIQGNITMMEEKLLKIQNLGNKCLVCGKEYKLFRSQLLPHYVGHFYSKISKGHEPYFTKYECCTCKAVVTTRKSRIIHLGVKHYLVLPYIEKLMKSRNLS